MSDVLQDRSEVHFVLPAWIAICVALIGFALALLLVGDHFDWQRPLHDIPALWLTGGMITAGLVFLLTYPLILFTLRQPASARRLAIIIVLLSGLVMRALMIPSTPALEDDFYRYLWDGAVTASGHNPYALAPGSARTDAAPAAIRRLAEAGNLVLDRVNHPELKTIYPPVAQASFAVAYMIEPWSLRAWRLVCLLGELATLGLLLVLLGILGRPKLWAALYWLNPLVVKELMNSAHMEAILLPLVLGAITLLALRQPVWAAATLGLAIGAKLWPALLVPMVLRPLLSEPRRLLIALLILAAMAVAWGLPPYLGGLGHDSGFVAFARHWQTNSALFQVLQAGLAGMLSELDLSQFAPGMIVRVCMAGVVLIAALWLARNVPVDDNSMVRQAGLIVLLLFLLSPAQFPWYAAWVIIFVPFLPLAGTLSLTALMPLYYVSFHLFAIGHYDRAIAWVIGAEWTVIALFFAWDAWHRWRAPLTMDLASGGIGWKRN